MEEQRFPKPRAQVQFLPGALPLAAHRSFLQPNWKKGSRCDRTARWLGGEPFSRLLSAALVLGLPTATGAESLSAPRPAASPGLIKHVAQGSFGLPASLAGGHIGGIARGHGREHLCRSRPAPEALRRRLRRQGTYLRSWQAGNGTGGIYRIPLTLGPDGLIYIIPEESVDTVKVFTTAGTLVRQFGAGSHIRVPSDIEVDQSGNVYVTSFPNPAAGIQHDVVTRLNPSGAVTGQWQPLPEAESRAAAPRRSSGDRGRARRLDVGDDRRPEVPVDPSRRQRQAAQDRGTPRSSFPGASRMSSGTSTTPTAGSTSAARSAERTTLTSQTHWQS